MTQSEVVHLTVNDQPHAVAKGATVSDLLRQLGLSSGQVAVGPLTLYAAGVIALWLAGAVSGHQRASDR